MRQDYQEFVKRGAEIVVLGPDDAQAFRAYWEKEKCPFVGLPDPKHQVLNLYGQEVKLLKLGRLPAQIVLDKQGQIRFAHYGEGMSDIPPNKELLVLLDQLS